VHIVGAAKRYPQAATRTYLAQPATLDELRRRAASRAISHFVIVQPSFYGTANSLLLESLDALGDRGRSVAVVDAATTHSTLLELAARRAAACASISTAPRAPLRPGSSIVP